ncbi:MAG TPA: glycosyltransferase [Urbifossiella sp.]|nr:glycosyltransferase [Urbifossiella sp.]
MGSPLHTVHGVLTLDVGGLERLVLGLVRQSVRTGHRVSVVCVEAPGQLAAEAEAAGAKVVSLDKPPGRDQAYVARAAEALAWLRPDVVHTHQIGAAWYLGPAARSLGVPVVHTEHGNHFARLGSRLAALKARLVFRSATRSVDRFCCVSDEIAAAVTRWRTVPRGKVLVVPNGISLHPGPGLPDPHAVRASLGIPADAPVVGTVGRLVEVKRQDLLIRAVARLRAGFPGVHLVLVGDGPERGRLEEVAREVGLADRTHFLSYHPRPEAVLGILTVFALTSRSEGFPVSLLEAWRAGVPVASAAVGGIPAVVSDGASGLLFPPGDEAAAAAALARLLGDPALAGRLGRVGRQTFEAGYTLDRMAATYEGLYRDRLAAPRAG